MHASTTEDSVMVSFSGIPMEVDLLLGNVASNWTHRLSARGRIPSGRGAELFAQLKGRVLIGRAQGEGDEQCERTSDWTCLPMRGVLEFWFTSQEHFIVVHERSSASEDPAGRAQPATYAVAPSDLQTNS